MNYEEGDDPAWTAARLYPDSASDGMVPNVATLRRLLKDICSVWLSDHVAHADIVSWMTDADHFDVDLANFSSWTEFDKQFLREKYRIMKLFEFRSFHQLDDGEFCQQLENLHKALHGFPELLKQVLRCQKNMAPAMLARRSCLPADMTDDERLRIEAANTFANDEADNNSFQNAFLHMLHILEGLEYRRVDEKFFKRVVTKTGMQTLAFQEEMTVAEFVGNETLHGKNFRVWKWSTNPHCNFEHLIQDLSNRPLPEAPDLKENYHIRSFAGDVVGRGCGVYNCACDFFFSYDRREEWPAQARLATMIRRRLFKNADYLCTPPDDGDVCVIHLDTAFPYSTLTEVTELQQHMFRSWRCAESYEILDAHKIECPKLEQLLLEKLPSSEERIPDLWGRMWQEVKSVPDDWVRILGVGMLEQALSEVKSNGERARDTEVHPFAPSEVEAFAQQAGVPIGERTYVKIEDTFWVPLNTPGGYARAHLTQDEWDSLGLSTSELTGMTGITVALDNGDVRHFRVDAGRTWRECDSEEIDTVYRCQQFCIEDCFMLYALKGRLFFKVKEMDNYEITLFLEGIGGCGKSTIIKVSMAFWPHHRRGIMSSNMQAQFGMSAVALNKSGGENAVVFNSEVNDNLQIPQEEWQQACSGEQVSLSVKHKNPVVMQWIAPMMWAGNRAPGGDRSKGGYDNAQGQCSRRLAGVKMEKPVQPRDGNIINKMMQKLGQLHRKEVLAYFEFLRIHGHTDPMSVPDKLPPAFANFYIKYRQACDPMVHFLSEGTFVKERDGATMLMSDFKELYQQYRLKYDLGKALRWSEDTYRNPFNEKNILVIRYSGARTFTDNAGQQYHDVDVIVGLEAVVQN